MKIHVKIVVGFMVNFFVMANLLLAQTTSQISGRVLDQSRLGIPAATATVTQTDTGLTRTVQTNETGEFSMTNLPVGPYRLEVTKAGFTAHIQTGIVLQVNSSPAVEVILNVGNVTQEIEVNANATMAETVSTGVGQVVDSEKVVNLPLNGRQVQQLIFLAGTSSTAPPYDLSNNKSYPNAFVISIAGGQPTGIAYNLDGGLYNDQFTGLSLPAPFPDVVQEFKVETSALPAQYGYRATGAVNMITKSGGNQFHGVVFEFVRNYLFNARNYYASQRDSLKRNQFGGTLGGPILKNKLFFFGGYQGTIVRTNPATSVSVVPTQAMLNGDFSAFASLACQGKNVNLPLPFVNNQVSPALFSTPALYILKNVPVSTNPCGTVTYGIPANTDEKVAIGRIDWLMTKKNTLFTRYNSADFVQPASYNGNLLTTTQAALDDGVKSFVLGDTYLLSQNTVSLFHATLNRTTPRRTLPQFFTPTQAGSNVYSAFPGYMVMTISGGFNLGSQSGATGYFNTTSLQLAEDINIQLGKHQIAFGVNWIHSRLNSLYTVQSNPLFSFNGQTTGLGLADFMLGDVATLTQGNMHYDDERADYTGLYVQDGWKLTPRLLINAGLRWDPFVPESNARNQNLHFSPAQFQQGVHSAAFPNAPAGLTFPGDKGFPGNHNSFSKLSNFAPRLGIIWDPRGDGRTTVRAGYGIFFDLPGMQYNQRFSYAPPWGGSVALTGPLSFENPWQNYPGGNPFPALNSGKSFPIAGVFVNTPLHQQPTYVQQWNLTLQRQLGESWLLTAGYLGNQTTHLWTGTEGNPAVYIPGKCSAGQYGLTSAGSCSTTGNTNARRTLNLQNPSQGQYYGSIITADDGGTAKYNALLLSVQHRFAQHFSILSNFTWSHCQSAPVINEPGGSGTPYIDPTNRKLDYGNCGQDLRKAFNVSLTAEAPKFRNKWSNTFLSDWRLSTVIVVRSGLWNTVTTGVDNALTGVAGQRPNIVGNPYAPNQANSVYLLKSAFASPTAGTFGNSGVYHILGPNSATVDVALSRLLTIHEAQHLEIRGEAFNIQNRRNAVLTNNALNSPLFGIINSAGDPRIMQFALKYIF